MKKQHLINPIRGTLKHVSLAVAVVAGLGATPTHAAIEVGASGSAVQTFDATPTVANGWSTKNTWAGAADSIIDPAGLDAAVQLLASTDITAPLTSSSSNPPSTNTIARQNSALKVLQTRPTGAVSGCLLMATLQNTRGVATNQLEISYNFGKPAAGVEQVPGLRAYYSLTGLASDWKLIPALSTDTAGALSTVVTFGAPWADATPMYVLWVDDNSTATGDAYTLDNVKFGLGADIKTFGLPATTTNISGTNITWYVPTGTDVTTLAPTYTLSGGASCLPASGATQDFTNPVHYIVTAGDPLVTQDYTVTASVGPVPVLISGTLTQTLDTVVGAGPALLTANSQTYWGGTTSTASILLNDLQFTLDNGGGNSQIYNGAITGPGTIRVQGRSQADWDPDIQLGGSVANTPTKVDLAGGRLNLNKTSGVDALAGTITVLSSSNPRFIWLKNGNQISDTATIDATVGTGVFTLKMNGFSERIGTLSIKTGNKVDTGVGGVLNVDHLIVDGVEQAKGAYTVSSGYVIGSGYIDVQDFGPPVILLPPGEPSSPTPADTDSTINPAYLAKLTWAVALDATSYDVYLWLASATKPETATATVPLNEYAVNPQVLSLENYKWQIVAKNDVGNTLGPVWTFTTIDRRSISGNLQRTLDAIVGAGPALLTGNAQAFWQGTTATASVTLNDFQFTIDNGGGNTQTYLGAITGPGTLRIVGRGDASWPEDIMLGGTLANNPTGVTLASGRCRLNKTDGVDALAGAITVNTGGVVRLQLLKSNQINDASTITSTGSSGGFYLEMGGFSDTIGGLDLKAGHMVEISDGGVLTVTNLTVNGEVKGPGTYRAADGFVTGTGTVVVPGAGTTYDSWKAAHAGGQTAGEDFDNDGVSNGVEYFMNAPDGFTPNPGVVAGKVTWPHVNPVASFVVQVSDNLTNWVPADSADIDTTTDPTKVVYTLPKGAAKKFCRLFVTP